MTHPPPYPNYRTRVHGGDLLAAARAEATVQLRQDLAAISARYGSGPRVEYIGTAERALCLCAYFTSAH